MCTNFAFVPLVYFFYPETANMSLESIDYLFTKKHVLHTQEGDSQVVTEDAEKAFS
jgi:hypothetical protein